MSGAILSPDGSLGTSDSEFERDREADHYGPASGGKKRKVPAYSQIPGPEEEESDEASPASRPLEALAARRSHHVSYRLNRSSAAQACSFRKALFLRRKAALMTLYLEAQDAILKGTAKLSQGRPPLPEVPAFERLLPALEGVGVSDWALDRPGWRNNVSGDRESQRAKTLGIWRTTFDRRQRVKSSHKPLVLSGWAPEGSFEFEQECKASGAARIQVRDRIALHKLINELRSVVLSVKPVSHAASVDSSHSLPPRTAPAPKKVLETASIPLSKTSSKDSSATGGKKKTKKKKKRSVLANQGNPHHVDNYRSSRVVSPHGDPYEPYPHHASLLFPPSMRLLATAPSVDQASILRAAEDAYVCCFCEYDLSWGTEAARKRAIRRLKAERQRKEHIRNKAKDVADGKGGLDDETDEDDEDWCDEDDGYGRCTLDHSCGRQTHRMAKVRRKPPELDSSGGQDSDPDGHDTNHSHHDHGHYDIDELD